MIPSFAGKTTKSPVDAKHVHDLMSEWEDFSAVGFKRAAKALKVSDRTLRRQVNKQGYSYLIPKN